MPEAIITVGVSASGKTTWSESQENYVNINRDDIRSEIIGKRIDYRTYKLKGSVEKRVTETQYDLAWGAVENDENIIISDTNLGPKTRRRWISFFEKVGYKVELKEFPVTLEEAWKRNSYRLNGLSHSVVYKQYQQWLSFKGRKAYKPDLSLPPAVISDIDGTVADHRDIRSPFDWNSVDQDRPRNQIIELVQGYHDCGYKIIFMSGRDGSCRELTEMWLADMGLNNYELFMRPEGSFEKDVVVKERLFWEDVADNYNVKVVVDDRPIVVRLWHELGIQNVICVGNPWKEF